MPAVRRRLCPDPRMDPAAPPSPALLSDFKQAMRRLASTVTIISTLEGEQRHGMAATAVNSVTTTPPTLLICVNQTASIHAPLLASGLFCVNLLGLEHQDLVPLYSGKAAGEERFRHGHWTAGFAGLPCLADAQASLCCSTLSATTCGSHTVFIGEVRAVMLSGEARPLIYQEGGLFRTVGV